MTARIFQIAYSGAGGTGELAVELARRIDRRRFEPAVCFFGVEPVADSFRQRLDAAGIEWSYLPMRGAVRGLWQLTAACLRVRPDVVIAHGSVNASVLPLLRIARPAMKRVAVFHGPPQLLEDAGSRLQWRIAAAGAHELVAVAPHLGVLARLKLGRECTVIVNGVEAGTPAGIPAQTPPELLMVATLSPAKDHETLLNAVSLLAGRGINFRLVLAGDGILRDALQRKAAQNVEFAGMLSAEERSRRLARASLFVFATHQEGCPLALLEAMAAGRPIVATRVPGVSEVIDDGRTGLLVPPRDPEAFAAAVTALLTDPARAAALGRAAREAAQAQFSIAACVRGYEALIDGLLQQQPVAERLRLAEHP